MRSLGAVPAFPSFEYQRIPEGTVVEYSGLEYSLSEGTARIPSVIQLVLNVPSLQRSVRIYVDRNDKINTVLSLLVSGQTWPGRRGRDFKPPDAESLSLVFEGQALDPSATVESTGLQTLDQFI